jgi:hypothetical protein
MINVRSAGRSPVGNTILIGLPCRISSRASSVSVKPTAYSPAATSRATSELAGASKLTPARFRSRRPDLAAAGSIMANNAATCVAVVPATGRASTARKFRSPKGAKPARFVGGRLPLSLSVLKTITRARPAKPVHSPPASLKRSGMSCAAGG